MADVRRNVSPGYVSTSPQDNVSSTGAQMCNAGNIMAAQFSVLWLETACRQELYLISMWEVLAFISRRGKGNFKGAKEAEHVKNSSIPFLSGY